MDDMYRTGRYAENNPTWHEEDAPWKAKQIERLMRKNNLVCRSICEVGCGTGNILLALEKAFPEAVLSGYEISPQAHERLNAKQTDRTQFHLCDVLAETGLYYDVVLIIDVIEHVEDYIGFVRRVRGLGQYKIFHIPLDLSVQSIWRKRPMMSLRRNVGHLHYFYKDTALATLEDCGYRIIDYCYTASRLELPNQALSSRLMKGPRRLLHAINADLAVRLVGGYSLLVLSE